MVFTVSKNGHVFLSPAWAWWRGGGSADGKTAAASGANNQAAASSESNTGKDDQTINFGIINTESSQNLKTDWEPFLADMFPKNRPEHQAFFVSDYAGVIQAMRFKKVDLAWYGNKSAMEAVDRADGEVFAKPSTTTAPRVITA